MAKHSKSDRADAVARLREWIKPGDTVYTILESVSRSGMSRTIRVVLPYAERTYPNFDRETGRCAVECECTFGRGTHGDFLQHHDPTVRIDFLHPNYAIGEVLGLRQAKRGDGLIVGGCGMDMGFHLVNSLSYAIYPEYQCLGKGKCPSNYHVNHRERERCPGADGRFCWKPDAYSTRFPVPEGWPYAEQTVTVDGDDGKPITHTYKRLLACLSTGDDSIGPVCPTCQGVGDIPNPDGPERWDLLHTDGYALRHRWL